MAKKKGRRPEKRFQRTTISIPTELKRRMENTEGVNWSSLACSAFAIKLGEIASRKKEKNLSDVIERLRASKEKDDDDRKVAGREAGELWIKEYAEVAEIRRLKDMWESTSDYDRHYLFETGERDAFSASQRLFFVIEPGVGQDRSKAEYFWKRLLVDNHEQQYDPAFMEGFWEGALDLWEDLEDEL